jgi:hypothetical protein
MFRQPLTHLFRHASTVRSPLINQQKQQVASMIISMTLPGVRNVFAQRTSQFHSSAIACKGYTLKTKKSAAKRFRVNKG